MAKYQKAGEVVIHVKAGRHLAFVGLTQLQTGELVVVYRHGAGHVDPEGLILLQRSSDDGATWSEPEVVVNSERDDRDSSIYQLPDGRVVLNYFSSLCDKPWDGEHKDRWGTGNSREIAQHNWSVSAIRAALKFSDDDGRTWSDEVVTGIDGLYPSEPVEMLSNGVLVMPVYGQADTPASAAWLLGSEDRGATWDRYALIFDDATGQIAAGEPTVMELEPGRVLCHFRTTGSTGCDSGTVYQVESRDHGRTWGEAQRLPLWGYPQSLIKLRDGGVISTYGHRRHPRGTRACYSPEGTRWDPNEEVTLLHTGVHGDLGYPSGAELADGRVFIAAYHNDADHVFPYIVGAWLEPTT